MAYFSVETGLEILIYTFLQTGHTCGFRINAKEMKSGCYLRDNITPINGENEPLAFAELMFGNCLLETTLGCYLAQLAPTPPVMQLGFLPYPIDGNETCTAHCNTSSSSSSTSALNGL